MNEKDKKRIVQMILNQNLEKKDKEEIIDMLVDNPISIDVEKEEAKNMTFGEKLADRFAEIAGSWGFIFFFTLFLILWIVINGVLLKEKAIDPYPFILLNLVLSCVAAIQAPIIMMSQNREAKKDSLRNQNDYKTDLKSELILEDLHEKIETLINNQIELIKIIDKIKNDDKNS